MYSGGRYLSGPGVRVSDGHCGVVPGGRRSGGRVVPFGGGTNGRDTVVWWILLLLVPGSATGSLLPVGTEPA